MRARLFSLTLSLAMIFPAFATPKPDDLIKVTPHKPVKCVEYYSYQGEMYCTTTTQNDDPPSPDVKNYEKLKIMFDHRPWLVAWGRETPTITTVEYIPKGENINQWHELITSQFIPDPEGKLTPESFAKIFIKGLQDRGFKPDVDYLEKTSDRIIFEFKIDEPKEQIQDELVMVLKDHQGLHVLHYVIKEADMGKKAREQWVSNFKNSRILK